MIRKLRMISGQLQENSFIVITLYPSQTVRAKEESFPVLLKYHRHYQNDIHILGCIIRENMELERGWRKRTV